MATAIDFECPRCSATCSHTMRGALVRCPRCGGFVQVPGMEGAGQVKAPLQPAARPDVSGPGVSAASADSSPEIDASAITAPEMDALPASPGAPEAPRAPASIVFSCKQCGSRIETEAANAGLPCLCPGCHVDLIIPGAARPIFLPPPPAARVSAPLWDRVMLAILVGVVALGAAVLVAMTGR